MKKTFIHRLLPFGMFFGFLILLFGILSTSVEKKEIITYNVNRTKSIEAVHIVHKYEALEANQPIAFFDSFQEAVSLGASRPVAFNGTLTGYGPDCVGCGGYSGCPPRQNFKNGNIYFNDQTYGKVRIVASDRAIPCGSIVRISNFGSSIITAVVLDRGGAIKNKKFDLLYASEQEARVVGKQANIHFEIIRWGW